VLLNDMERIGLFGGSFNPVHLGHLLVARAALEELQLARLVFIPAAQSPFKPGAQLAPAPQRVQLLRLALAGETRCSVDELELERGGVSYSIDTVREYVRRFPHAQLWYLIGADHVRFLSKWREADELAQLIEFAVIPRPGEGSVALPPPFKGSCLRGWPLALSASEIRHRIRSGRPIAGLVPNAVAEAIRNNGLYL
jgi:nicotinate-nucleotide adenylyltransferase